VPLQLYKCRYIRAGFALGIRSLDFILVHIFHLFSSDPCRCFRCSALASFTCCSQSCPPNFKLPRRGLSKRPLSRPWQRPYPSSSILVALVLRSLMKSRTMGVLQAMTRKIWVVWEGTRAQGMYGFGFTSRLS